MNIQGIYHKAKSNYAYAYKKDEMHIKIKTAKGDFDKITLVFGDKYEWHRHEEINMDFEFHDEYYDYYMIRLKNFPLRLSYYFKLIKGKKEYYFTERGFREKLGEEVFPYMFHYPYVNEGDIHLVPEWVKDAVFYQIFPDRFYRGDMDEKANKLSNWDDKPEGDSFYGGDIKGIIEKLPYLQNLGINTVYLTPVFKSISNHKYNTHDYMDIDEDFGTKEDFRTLVEKAHKLGIKIVLDAVFNHSGHDFFAFQDLLEKQEKSEYKDWFHIKEFPVDFEKLRERVEEKGWKDWYRCEESGKDLLSYHTFAHTPYMPKLNTENKELRKYLLDVGRYWVEEFDIDGWRLDVANEVDHGFWRDFRKAVKEVKEDVYIVGEIWHDSTPWLQGDQYDAVMNYPITEVIIDYFAKKNMETKEFRESISEILYRYTWQVNEVMLNLLDSHDTSRFLNKADFDVNRLILAETFLFAFVGAPMLYYGTEIGMVGGDDPDCRRGMIWDEEKWNKELFKEIKKVIKIRNENISLRRGDIKFIEDKHLVVFERTFEEEKILVIINNTDKKHKINITREYENKIDLLSGEKVERKLEVKGNRAYIIKE